MKAESNRKKRRNGRKGTVKAAGVRKKRRKNSKT